MYYNDHSYSKTTPFFHPLKTTPLYFINRNHAVDIVVVDFGVVHILDYVVVNLFDVVMVVLVVLVDMDEEEKEVWR